MSYVNFDETVTILANYFSDENPNFFLNKLKSLKKSELQTFALLTFLGKHYKTMDKANNYSHAGTVTMTLNNLIFTSSNVTKVSKSKTTEAIFSLIKQGLISIAI